MTGIERRIVEFRAEMTELRAHVDQGFAKLGAEITGLRGELNTLRRAFGFMFAVQVAILVKLFVH